MRYFPRDYYNDKPCSYVSVGVAYENLVGRSFNLPLQEELKENGYFTLDKMNKFIRFVLPIKRKVYFKRNERMLLKDLLGSNDEKCIVCVLGHYIYVDCQDYWSFFDNENDEVVCVWYIKE